MCSSDLEIENVAGITSPISAVQSSTIMKSLNGVSATQPRSVNAITVTSRVVEIGVESKANVRTIAAHIAIIAKDTTGTRGNLLY